jgi:hypothetical protein
MANAARKETATPMNRTQFLDNSTHLLNWVTFLGPLLSSVGRFTKQTQNFALDSGLLSPVYVSKQSQS